MRQCSEAPADQAATLRRLFARPRARLLPVLLPADHHTPLAAWVARLARCFASAGERTLVVDAARAQVAAALGLRARFDLAHALRGECAPQRALLDAGGGLSVLPAARALAGGARPLAAALAPALAAGGGCDLVLLLAAGEVRARGDVLVPMTAEAACIARTLRALERSARAAGVERASSATFRLLFLGMPAAAAATLTDGLALRLHRRGTAPRLLPAGAAQGPADLEVLVRASAGWTLDEVQWMQ